MKHRRLFDLRVRHEYFAGRGCPDLRISPQPTSDGARALARHRLLARPCPDGLEILGPVDDAGQPFITLTDLRLTFAVQVTHADFHHYTDLTAWAALPAPLYRGAHADGGGALTLAAGDPPLPAGAAASIHITGITADWLAAPPRFTLELPATRAAWVFYLLTARPTATAPEIRDGEPGRDLAFERVLLGADGVTAGDDPVGHHLLATHPDRRCFRFTSTRPLACRSAPTRGLALHLGDELLLRELGSPDIRSRAAISLPDAASQHSLFRVIEY